MKDISGERERRMECGDNKCKSMIKFVKDMIMIRRKE